MGRAKQRAKARRIAQVQAEREARRLAAVGVVLMLFGVAALLTSFFFLAPLGKRTAASVPVEGGTVGPIVLTAPRTLLHVRVRQSLHDEGWSYVEGKLLDQQQSIGVEFGGEVWYETGSDSDGPWSARKSEFDLHVLVPEPGTYHFSFATEAWQTRTMRIVPPGEVAGPMFVVVQPQTGSPVPFRTAGLLALLIGFILHETATGAVCRWLASLQESRA